MFEKLPMSCLGIAYALHVAEKNESWVFTPFEPASLSDSEMYAEVTDRAKVVWSKDQQHRLALFLLPSNSRSTPWWVEVAGLLARHGQMKDCLGWMQQCVTNGPYSIDPLDRAKMRLLWSNEKKYIRRLVQRQREWPRGVWHLEDVPGGFIPPFILLFRKMIHSSEFHIFSACHAFGNDGLHWIVRKKSTIPEALVAHEILL